jgi:solute carrier family 66 (lysosomal lysine-arginine transporter), member 1
MIAESSRSSSRVVPTILQTVFWNTTAVLMVVAAGVAGWFLSGGSLTPEDGGDSSGDDSLTFNLLGQVFGWFCAALYLGSRLPQLLLNWRRKSTEGVSMLFFIFACLGNMTYVLSILAYDPKCQEKECGPGEIGQIYGQYILVNLSWIAGSFGTLLLDMGIFVQFFMYNKLEGEDDEDEEAVANDNQAEQYDEDDEQSIDGDRWDPRPLLARGDSTFG